MAQSQKGHAMTTQTKAPHPRVTGTALQDTTRAEKRNAHNQDSTRQRPVKVVIPYRPDIDVVSFEQRHYRIWSESDPTVNYDVKWIDKEWVCACPGHTYRGWCKHTHHITEKHLSLCREQRASIWRQMGREWPELAPERQATARLEADYEAPFTPGGVS